MDTGPQPLIKVGPRVSSNDSYDKAHGRNDGRQWQKPATEATLPYTANGGVQPMNPGHPKPYRVEHRGHGK
jgi:hypothetical protein